MLKTVALLSSLLGLCTIGHADDLVPTTTPRSEYRTIDIDGMTRSYRVFIPPNLPDSPAPLVIAFHGGGSTAVGMERFTHFSELAEREKFIVAYPEGYNRNWNDGRIVKKSKAHSDNIDDVRFVTEMIDAISRERRIDDKRIYATGISNGGIFSHYFAANRAGRIAAIAPVAGGVADPFYKRFAPEQPVSVLILQGTRDPLVPYKGGRVAWNRGEIISTDDAVELWTDADATAPEPKRGTLPDIDPNDGCQVSWSSWTGGKNGTEVTLYTLEGAGHTWPGGAQYLPERIIGKVCRDFDATETIWKFFKDHPKT